MDPARYRRLLAACGIALTALVAVVWALNPSGDEAALPAPLERVFPLPGDSVVRQTVIEVQLPVGYEVSFVVDGRPVPADEVAVTAALGLHRWQPAPGGMIEVWTPGEHTVEIAWDRTAGGRPDPGSFRWTFRVA